jgi:uncharacterized protein DUF4062
MIRTPDQRVRVFVSSTLGELAAERQGAAAITQLRLTPVLFELGARPYPPRDLYRAYLEPPRPQAAAGPGALHPSVHKLHARGPFSVRERASGLGSGGGI